MIFRNTIIRPLQLTLLSYRSRDKWSEVVISQTCQFYPQKLHNLTGFFGASFCGNLYLRGDDFSKIIEQIYYFSDPLQCHNRVNV